MRQFAVILAITFTLGCSRSPLADVNAPSRMTLYSIDGRDESKRLQGLSVKPIEDFYGYPVLGKVEIQDADIRMKLVDALKDGYARRPEVPPACFWPRHGVRIVEAGRTVDFVICFECNRLARRSDNLPGGLINSDVQPIFDKPLTDAGIPIAPK